MENLYPDAELWLIIGADGIGDFPKWRESQEIIKLAGLAVGARPGHEVIVPSMLKQLNARVRLLNGPCCLVSSTQIRDRVNQGTSIHYRVPHEVELFIKENGLYL